jgi:pyruvate/2-oxoglutarate dehydrogenase complex dihydrolipoamide dehydrogenase (E3) component
MKNEGKPPPAILELPQVQPLDQHNTTLVSNVHPTDHVNPEPASRYNLVVLGAGTAGLVTAAGAAGLGAKVALVEKHLLGGDCLNVGCVPSKAIIRSSRIFGDYWAAEKLGVHVKGGVQADFGAAMERMRRLRAHISGHDSVRRFRELGVDVFLGQGRFSGFDTLEVEGKTIRFKKAVLATGARAARPSLPGLSEAGFLTNETVFSLTELPRRLAVFGAGPIGCELSQVFRRFGSDVTIIESAAHLLSREDADAAEIVQNAFLREGVRLLLNTQVKRVEKTGDAKVLHFEARGEPGQIAVDEILVGAGRQPNVEGLGLDAAGVEYDPREGVKVDDFLRTTNPRIFAAGDVCLRHKFTHTADATARIVIQNALFLGRKRLSALTIPWCTYTDPEIAHVGMYEKDAQARRIEVDTFHRSFSEVDRAILDGEEEGFVKIHVRRGTDEILGATIVARHAGEMVSEITLAMVGKVGLKTLASVIHPYPTQAEAIRQTGDLYNRTRLTPFAKSALTKWLGWTR